MQLYSPDAPLATRLDHLRCRDAIRQGSHSFHAASLLLPASIRAPAYGLYAFCRLSDDAIDTERGSPETIARLRQRLARVYEGRPEPYAADRVMAEVVRRYAIPFAAPSALLDGLAYDAEGRRFEEWTDLLDYAARVAGTVGVMMTLIMGVRDAQTLARACDLGVAMQLTNIARDVGEDARAGRMYLPLRWLREAGVDLTQFLADPRPSAALSGVVERVLTQADRLYARARGGVARLPVGCRPAIYSAALLYAEIGARLRSAGNDSITARARVPSRRKASLIAGAVARTPLLRGEAFAPPLDECAFLLDAIDRTPAPASVSVFESYRRDMVNVLDMFERLGRVERYGE